MTDRFAHSCALSWSDMDAYGHVNNSAFGRYFEDARVSMLYDLLPPSGSPAPEHGFVVSRQTINYLTPLTYRPEPVMVEIWTTRLRTFSFDLAAEVSDSDRVYATAWTMVVGYDLAHSQIRPLRQSERERLRRHRGDPQATPAFGMSSARVPATDSGRPRPSAGHHETKGDPCEPSMLTSPRPSTR